MERYRYGRKGMAGMAGIAAIIAFCAPNVRAQEVETLARMDIDDFKIKTVPVPNGEPAVFYPYLGAEYQQIVGAAMENRTLEEKRVCLDGKYMAFDKEKGDVFQLFETRTELVVTRPGLKAAIESLPRGTNLWVAGRAKAYSARHAQYGACYMAVDYVVRLPSDTEILQVRLDRIDEQVQKGAVSRSEASARLIDLSEKLEKSARMTGLAVTPDQVEGQRHALRRALTYGVEGLDRDRPDYADGYFALGMKYLQKLNDNQKAVSMFRRAVSIDPGHKAGEQLKKFGFQRWGDQWLSEELVKRLAEADRRRRQEEQKVEALVTTIAEQKIDRYEAYLAHVYSLDRILRQAAGATGDEAMRRAQAAARVMAAYDHRYYPRDAVWMLVNHPNTKVALEGLATGLSGDPQGLPKALSPTVRRDAIWALLWRDADFAIPRLARTIADPREDLPVRQAACERLTTVALQNPATVKTAVATLAGLPNLDEPALNAVVDEALRKLTGQNLSGAAAWKTWWSQNKDTFAPRAP